MLFRSFAIAAGLLVWVIGWMLSRPVPPATSSPVEPQPEPHLRALERLQALRIRAGTISAYALGIEVSDILRTYIESRFALPIRFQTSREFLETAAGRPELQKDRQSVLKAFLGFCDLVKFAQRPASADEQQGLLDTAETFIRRAAGLIP